MARMIWLSVKLTFTFALFMTVPLFCLSKFNVQYNKLINHINNMTNIINNLSSKSFSLKTIDKQYSTNPSEACSQRSEIELVICATVSMDAFVARETIRDTWGSYANVTGNNAVLLFFVGLGRDDATEGHIKVESEMYNDIVMGDYIDSYRNLTLKSISALRWVNRYCSRAEFMLKIDGDVYINIPKLLKTLRFERDKNASVPFVLGKAMVNTPVHRHDRSKWKVSKEDYPHKTYPKYVDGAAYTMNKAAFKALLRATYKTQRFWIEDVYISGICGELAGVKRINNPQQYRVKIKESSLCAKQSMVSSHGYNPTELRQLYWRIMNLKCK